MVSPGPSPGVPRGPGDRHSTSLRTSPTVTKERRDMARPQEGQGTGFGDTNCPHHSLKAPEGTVTLWSDRSHPGGVPRPPVMNRGTPGGTGTSLNVPKRHQGPSGGEQGTVVRDMDWPQCPQGRQRATRRVKGRWRRTQRDPSVPKGGQGPSGGTRDGVGGPKPAPGCPQTPQTRAEGHQEGQEMVYSDTNQGECPRETQRAITRDKGQW